MAKWISLSTSQFNVTCKKEPFHVFCCMTSKLRPESQFKHTLVTHPYTHCVNSNYGNREVRAASTNFLLLLLFFFWPSGRASSLYTSVHSYKTKACADALTVQTQLVINACIVFGLPKDTLTYPVWTHFTVVQETHSPEDNINMFSVFNTIWPLFPLYDFKITTMWFTSKSENWSQSHHFTFLLLSKPTKIY